jgi:tight adherence protein C
MFTADLMWLLLGLGLAATSVYLFSSALFAKNQDAEALLWASGNEPRKSKSGFINFSRPLVHNFTLQHAARVKSESYRKSVEEKILRAGLGDELNVDEFIGLQILWGIMAPAFLMIVNFALQLGYPTWFCLSLGFAGFFFPHLYCRMNAQQRYVSVITDLPFFIDLLALSTEAGLDFINGIQRIVDKAQTSVLAEELKVVLKDIKLGRSRAESLRALSFRLDIPEITSFVAVVNDADYTGASIAKVLKDQSAQMRLDRFVRAEKMGARASQAMLIPMMVFILPAIFIVVMAPVILQFFYGGSAQ